MSYPFDRSYVILFFCLLHERTLPSLPHAVYHSVYFAYSLDIMWGTDWPYSGIFWTCPNGEIAKKIDIYATGLVRLVVFFIKVNDYPVFSDMNCDSHSEWRP